MKFEKLLPVGSKRRELAKKIFGKQYKKYSHEEREYMQWIKNNEPNKKQLKEQYKKKFEINPKISIVVPVYNTPENFFDELVESLKKQTYSNWELCLADGSPEPLKFIEKYCEEDKRIKYTIIGENKGISGNTNEALKIATGDFIGLLDHDDLLPVFSLYEVVKAINENPEVEFIYSDEDKIEKIDKPRYGVFFKPDFSTYTLNSANYICHFSVFKKELMDKLGGFRSEYDGSQDFDIVVRASENTKNIVHIPKVLYHWRVHQNSTAGNSDSKPYAFEVGKNVIKDHLKRCGIKAEVEHGLTLGSYEVKYSVNENPKVSIIIDGIDSKKDKIEKVIENVRISTYESIEIILITNLEEKFNVDKIVNPKSEEKFEIYNQVIEESNGKYFMIIDENIIKIDKKEYIQELLGICQNEDVGIVGTKLYNKEEKVEHCGIILGMNGSGDFLYKGAPKDIGTYMQRLLIIHNVTCVYFKYAMIDKEDFMKIKGFSNKYKSELTASIDMCLKLLDSEKQVIINPIISICVEKISNVTKIEEEENKIQEEWKDMYKKGDIYFSPNLSKTNTGLSINID